MFCGIQFYAKLPELFVCFVCLDIIRRLCFGANEAATPKAEKPQAEKPQADKPDRCNGKFNLVLGSESVMTPPSWRHH